MPHLQTSAVSLRIFGDNLVPDEITRLLGATPTYSQSKGEKMVDSKTGTVRNASFGSWRLSASDRAPGDVDGQIREILGQTTADLSVWRTIAESCQLDLFCGLFLLGRHEGLVISAESLAALGDRRIQLGIDIYAGDNGPALESLTDRRQKLEAQLNDLVDRRGASSTEAERLKLLPKINQLIGAIQQIDSWIQEQTGKEQE